MKRAALTIIAIMTFLTAWSQGDVITREQADKLDSVTVKLMKQERFGDAIKTIERELAILKSLYGEKDSTYIRKLAFSAKLYFRDQQQKEAVEIVGKAVNLYGENVSNKDSLYAFYLDNLSHYQISIKEYAKAKENCRKALTIYEQLGIQDYDLAAILMHMAEACYYCNEYQDAVKHELRSLNIIENIYGKHSDEYIDELPYLQEYYLANGDQKNADGVEKSISKLQQEKENGIVDLPELIEFKSAEVCREHNADAMTCIKYFLSHTLNAPQTDDAAQYILNWSAASDDVHIVIGEEMSSLADNQTSMPYLVAYIAACSYCCLRDGTQKLDEQQFQNAMDILLQFYEPNEKLTGKVDLLDKYLKLQKRGKLEKELSKVFAKQSQDK